MSGYESGYTRLHPVPIEAPAEMLESWAGYTVRDAEKELSFALASLNANDPGTLQWLACGIERRLADLSARTTA